MIEKVKDFITENELNIFDIAIMCDGKDGEIQAYNFLEKRSGNVQAFKYKEAPKEYVPDVYENFSAYPNYSMTKLLIVTMIGVLIDRGMLCLESKITDILKNRIDFDYDPIWDKVTVRHALKHSIGIDFGVIDIDRDDPNGYEEDYLKMIMAYPPKHTPGSYRLYTDVPHYILSAVINSVTKRRTQDVIDECIFRPLNVRQAGWCTDRQGNAVGSSGSFMSASDVIRLAWLYKEKGIFNGKRILSEEWCETAEKEKFDIYRVKRSGFIGKGGMFGQMTMYSREYGMAVAWHGYEPDGKDFMIADYIAAEAVKNSAI